MTLLSIVCLFPLISSILLLIIPKDRISVLKISSLSLSIVTFILSLILWLYFDNSYIGFQYYSHLLWIPFLNIEIWVGLDGISLYFLLLTTFLTPICILIGWKTIQNYLKEYLLAFIIMESLILISFVVLDLFLFYIFFESILIPMFIIIGLFGSRERKIHAAYKFFFYTLTGSILMLLSILLIYSIYGTTNLEVLLNENLPFNVQLLCFLAFFASFATKIPMIPVHIWLPEAHVEAPTAGSVILAGILLKLGGYGFCRFSIPLFPDGATYLTPFIYLLSIIAIIYASMTTIRQIDLKKIIAYSSVAHMNVVTLGLFSYQLEGIEGGILLMVSHGFISSALFLSIGIVYDRHHTRLLPYYGGLALAMPLYSIFFVMLSLSNISVPTTSSFVGELLIFFSLINSSLFTCFFAATGMILGAIYAMWLCNRLLFGSVQITKILPYTDINYRELVMLIPFILLIFLVGIYPNSLLIDIHSSSSAFYSLYSY